jgi:hypothetical protein
LVNGSFSFVTHVKTPDEDAVDGRRLLQDIADCDRFARHFVHGKPPIRKRSSPERAMKDTQALKSVDGLLLKSN